MDWIFARTRDQAKRLGERIVEVVNSNARAAAALYTELFKLPNAQLKPRGIPRGELHGCVFETLTKTD